MDKVLVDGLSHFSWEDMTSMISQKIFAFWFNW